MSASTTPGQFIGRMLVLFGLLLGPAWGWGQSRAMRGDLNDTTSYDTHKNLIVATAKFAAAQSAMTGFIRQRAVQVLAQQNTPERLVAEFSLTNADLPRLDSLASALGYVLVSNLNSQNLKGHREELSAAAQRLDARVQSLQQQQTNLNPTNKTALEDLTREEAVASDRLAELRHELRSLDSHNGQAYVTLRLFDEVSFPNGNRRVSFVNMPGVEFNYLRLDNPKIGLTSPVYQGCALKYLVTRGKSYLNLGVYKPMEKNSTDEFINELFVINFGQDFYPRSFGRGRRRYFNLYTSYQLGGFFLNRNSEKGNEFIPNLNLGLGVEVLKSRHVLIDLKSSYFIPLNNRSRDLRGVLGQAAFNFVF